mmetsp:Transcript_37497/g.37049  ORF Transcript_37497/g.37049 Transcript_37497/m.37049 type:complete len:98 (+) Transcript_37497:1045-1338(+)
MPLDLDGMLLGDSFLRGSKIIHDVDGKRLGIFPQKFYKSSSGLLWLWILLPVLGVILIGIGGFCLYKRRVEKKSYITAGGNIQNKAMHGNYQRVGGN